MDRDQLAEHLRFAQELGVTGVSRDPAWREREDRSAGLSGLRPAALKGPLYESEEARTIIPLTQVDALAEVRADIGDCTRCKLHTLGRTQVVFGVGNPNADLMFVGEAPGADEDIQGIPFVGRAGQLLTDIIEKGLKIPRKDVYIANVIKCRPPQNRNPEPDEILACQPFLEKQIAAIQPEVIVGLGKFAAQWLFKSMEPISRLRGRIGDYNGIKTVATFHP